ncbi:MAG: recombinase RecB, partial [Thermoplasmata archaeon]
MVELEDWFYKYNSWSFSKHRLWNSCKLAYYYQYIGPALKNPEELDVKILRELKELKNKFALQGILIHEVIEDQISQYQNGKNMSEEK